MRHGLTSFSIQLVMLIVLAFSSSGCTLLMVGTVGAVGGYALSRDTFEGMTNNGQDEVWDASHKVASIMGTITEERQKQGELDALISGARVTIIIIPVNLTTTKLRIKARKTIFPRAGVAQEVYTKIVNQLGQ
jgi:hypothetical protein